MEDFKFLIWFIDGSDWKFKSTAWNNYVGGRKHNNSELKLIRNDEISWEWWTIFIPFQYQAKFGFGFHQATRKLTIAGYRIHFIRWMLHIWVIILY